MGTREGWNDKHMEKPEPTPCIQRPSPKKESSNHNHSWDQHPESPMGPFTGPPMQMEIYNSGFHFHVSQGVYSWPGVTATTCTEWRDHNMRGHSWESYFGDIEDADCPQSPWLASWALFFGGTSGREQLEGPLGPLLELGQERPSHHFGTTTPYICPDLVWVVWTNS